MSESQNESTAPLTMRAASRSSFWSHYSTIINFWLDIALAGLFMVQACQFAILHFAFPRGAGSDRQIWGATPLDWSEALFITFCLFSLGVVLHVMFHWEWICGVVATRLLRIKATKDDGTHTIIGVLVLIFLIHVVLVSVLVAKISLVTIR